MERLAKLGSPEACFYMGEKIFNQHEESFKTLTRTEREDLAEKGIKYLKIAEKTDDIVARFLCIGLQVQYEGFNNSQWTQMLKDVRNAKSSGKLNSDYMIICDYLIHKIVEMVDKTEEKERLAREEQERLAREQAEKERLYAQLQAYATPSYGSNTCKDCKYYFTDIDLPYPVCKFHQFHFEGDYTPCSHFTK